MQLALRYVLAKRFFSTVCKSWRLFQVTPNLLLVVCFSLITSCSSTKGSWECPLPKGGKGNCRSIAAADNSSAAEAAKPKQDQASNTSPQKPSPVQLLKEKDKTRRRSFWAKFGRHDSKTKEPNREAISIQSQITADGLGEKMSVTGGSVREGASIVATATNLRSPEKIGRIYFAPYVDSAGNRHSESFIFVVDEESKWIQR